LENNQRWGAGKVLERWVSLQPWRVLTAHGALNIVPFDAFMFERLQVKNCLCRLFSKSLQPYPQPMLICCLLLLFNWATGKQ